MGILLKNNFSKTTEWWSKPVVNDDNLALKKSYNTFIEDIKNHLSGPDFICIKNEYNYLSNNNRLINSYKNNFSHFNFTNVNEKEYFSSNTKPIFNCSNFKVNWYRSGINYKDISVKNLIFEKSIEEINIKNSAHRLAINLRKIANSLDLAEVDFTEVKFKQIHTILYKNSIDTYSCANIFNDFEILKISKNKLRTIKGFIKIAINKFPQLVRNLKKHFTKNHSFHFKNLDDYHSSILFNSCELIKV